MVTLDHGTNISTGGDFIPSVPIRELAGIIVAIFLVAIFDFS
jgi:hypothetical protein